MEIIKFNPSDLPRGSSYQINKLDVGEAASFDIHEVDSHRLRSIAFIGGVN